MATNHGEWLRGVEAAGQARATAGADPATRAAAVQAAVDPLLAARPGAPQRACQPGCAHCCRFPVGITFAEARLLASVVATSSFLCGRVLADAAATAALPFSALVGRPCPLLQHGACMVYSVRPLPCRALASADAAACERAAAGDSGFVPRDDTAWWRGLGAAAVLGADAPAGTRELRAALAALLGDACEPAIAFAAARAAGPDR